VLNLAVHDYPGDSHAAVDTDDMQGRVRNPLTHLMERLDEAISSLALEVSPDEQDVGFWSRPGVPRKLLEVGPAAHYRDVARIDTVVIDD
jgi:hypothetical protein